MTAGDRVIVMLSGEIDIATAPGIERQLQEAESCGRQTIVLDLAAVDFIDSTGVHILIRAQHRANANGRGLVLTRIPAQAQRLFAITGITELFTIE